jgi:hypothetical protein
MADKSLLRPNPTFYRGNQPQFDDARGSPASPPDERLSSVMPTFNACLNELTNRPESEKTRRRLETYSVSGPTPAPIAPLPRNNPGTWAGDSSDRSEFLKEVEAQITRGAGETGVIALTHIAREHLHNPSAIAAFRDSEDPPPLPENVATIYVPNTEWHSAFDAYKRSGAIPEHVSIKLLPKEVVDQCENAPLWQCEKITDALVTKGAPEAVTVAQQLASFKKWQRTNGDTMAIAARISGTAIRNSGGLAGRVLLTDFEASQEPPPLLPPCVNEIYVRDKKTAEAYKAKYPDVTILCLETLSETLKGRQEEQPTDFDPITRQYVFAKTSNSPERSEPEEQHGNYRQLAEFK